LLEWLGPRIGGPDGQPAAVLRFLDAVAELIGDEPVTADGLVEELAALYAQAGLVQEGTGAPGLAEEAIQLVRGYLDSGDPVPAAA
jgi:hypothetical protein